MGGGQPAALGAPCALVAAVLAWSSGGAAAGQGSSEPVKIALIGDQGLGDDAEAVLELIAAEGADAVVHAGDFDYDDCPSCWAEQFRSILGADFPYFAAAGNHDEDAWDGYRPIIEQQLLANGIAWDGTAGELSSYEWRGIFFAFGAPDLLDYDGDTDVAPYFDEVLAATDAPWRITCWHVLMEAMQVGGKDDESGWGVYETSREHGAICATGHEHSYARTHLLSDMSGQVVADDDFDYVLAAGKTIAFHSGIAGRDIRDQERCFPAEPPYGCNGEWASIYTEDQNAAHGALFITFRAGGDPCRAHGYFKAINGAVPDEFWLTSEVGACACPADFDGDGGVGSGDFLSMLTGWGACPTCAADLDGDFTVGLTDLLQMLAAWGTCASPCPADLDGDGAVGVADFLALLTTWGSCVPDCPQDLDGDGDVDLEDMLQMLSGWGDCG